MHDPLTQICTFPSYAARQWMERKKFPKWMRRFTLFTLWHVDPEKDGTDDSCGWFPRARHGSEEVVARIIKLYEGDWDRTYSPNRADHDEEDGEFKEVIYYTGLFKPDGSPNLSVHGIVLNLFFLAALEFFTKDGRRNWGRSKNFMQENLFEILLFAENPTDSLNDGIVRKFEVGCGEAQTKSRRQDRIASLAYCIYAWILRQERPWYKHPRWHIHHWKIQIDLYRTFRRWLLSRCKYCHKPFSWKDCVNGNVVGLNWDSTPPKFMQGETDIVHFGCSPHGLEVNVKISQDAPPA